jgi:hypothetical protein
VDDDAAALVTEDFAASGCDGWVQLEGAGFSAATVDVPACGVRACEICATAADAGGFVGAIYPMPALDGGTYKISGWLVDRDAGSAALYTLTAYFPAANGVLQANGGLTANWTLATSPVGTFPAGDTRVVVEINPRSMQVGGCLRVARVRLARAP